MSFEEFLASALVSILMQFAISSSEPPECILAHVCAALSLLLSEFVACPIPALKLKTSISKS